jgi:CDP-diacylglycerol pyrophosphatase
MAKLMIRTSLVSLFALAALAFAPAAARADPEFLWKTVHDQCAANEASKGDPSPCLAVDLTRGEAVLKDRNGHNQVLLIPTDRVTGIESAVVLGAAGARYLWDAWQARSWVEKLAGAPVPRDDLSLAVNSIDGRTQNQLHIHVDCIDTGVKATLDAALANIGASWSTVTLMGHPYRAERLSEADLKSQNLFALIAKDSDAAANMGLETIVVVPVTYPGGGDGFVLLNGQVDPEAGDYGSGEELQDHGCGVLSAPPPSAH